MTVAFRSIAMFAGLFAAGALALRDKGGPDRDLGQDLQKLNVRHRTEHYELAGTVKDEQLIEYGRCLEYIHREFSAGFDQLLKKPNAVSREAPRASKEASPERFRVIVLASQAEYDELTQAYFGSQAEFTRGMFVPGAKLLVICDDGNRSEAYEVLFHEAFHQFARRHVPLIPIWLNEGLATYYGYGRPTAKGIVFDRPSSGHFRVVRDASSAKQLIPLEKLMGMSVAEFYDSREVEGISWSQKTLAYSQAYTLVAYMLSDRAGAGKLQEYLRRLAEAEKRDDVQRITEEVFPPALLKAMTPQWLAKVQRGG